MITDPHAYSLSVRCGVVPPDGGVTGTLSESLHATDRVGAVVYLLAPRLTPLCGVVTLQNFNNTSLSIHCHRTSIHALMELRLCLRLKPYQNTAQESCSLGVKSPHMARQPISTCECCIGTTHSARFNEHTCSPPVQDVLLRSFPTGESSPKIAERTSVSFLYVSLKPDGLSFPPGVRVCLPC